MLALAAVLAGGVVLAFAGGLGVWWRGNSSDAEASSESGPGNREVRYEAEQAVDIWQAGRWLPGRIRSVGTDRYFVFYDGYSVSWNEWVGPERLRRASAPPPGSAAPAR